MTPTNRRLHWVVLHAPRILSIVIALSMVLVLFTSRPTRTITIEAGTPGGLFDVMSEDLAESLAPHGIKVKVVNRPDSLNIINDIADEESPVMGGFIASDIPVSYHESVKQLGTVMLAPVYLMSRSDSTITDIRAFAGKSISLYPVDSAAWAVCQYVLQSYDVTPDQSVSQYGNGPTIVKNVVNGVTDVGCFCDVPSGTKLEYADEILNSLASERLRFIDIPQAAALQSRKDFLRPTIVPSGSFNVNPPRPANNVLSTAVSISFVAKESLSRELVIMISDALSQQYGGTTSSNQAGELPTNSYINMPSFREANNVYSNGLPWLYREFPFGIAGFLDKFFGRYGVIITAASLVLFYNNFLGLPTVFGRIDRARPRRMKLTIEDIARRSQKSGSLSERDERRLASIERRLDKQSGGIGDIRVELQELRRQLSHRPPS